MVRATALQIHWHQDNSPIYSIDFQPNSDICRFATAGGDNNVRIWCVASRHKTELPLNSNTDPYLSLSKDSISSERREGFPPQIRYLTTLSRHTQAVNAVRFSPKGDVLASGGDDGSVLIWVPSDSQDSSVKLTNEEMEQDLEHWRCKIMCRSMGSEIYDIAWSPDGQFLITGSMDNVAQIYSTQDGQMIRQIAEHSHYVQGVAWDPLNEYIATQSSDRSMHVYTIKQGSGKEGTSFEVRPLNKISRIEMSSPTFSTPHKRKRISMVETGHPNGPAKEALASALRHDENSRIEQSPIGKSLSNNDVRTSLGMDSCSLSETTESSSRPIQSLNGDSGDVSVQQSRTSRRRLSDFESRSRSASPIRSALPAIKPSSKAFMYHNETLVSFFRRLTFTPDGSLLLTPTGQFKLPNDGKNGSIQSDGSREEFLNTVYIYSRAGLAHSPVAHLPGQNKASVTIRCSPVFYKLKESPLSLCDKENTRIEHAVENSMQGFDNREGKDEKSSQTSGLQIGQNPSSERKAKTTGHGNVKTAFNLPYRMVYAVATQNAVYLYDTQHEMPICTVNNLHYASFTDLAWSDDGQMLFMASTDGFCSCLCFDNDELGERTNIDIHRMKFNANAKTQSPVKASQVASTPISPDSETIATTQAGTLHGRPDIFNGSSPTYDAQNSAADSLLRFWGQASTNSNGDKNTGQNSAENELKEQSEKRLLSLESNIEVTNVKKRIAPTFVQKLS